MAYRYCESCDRWIEQFEQKLSTAGQPICPTCDIDLIGRVGARTTYRELKRDLLLSHPRPVVDGMVNRAAEQGLV